MKAIVQRVSQACVVVEGKTVSAINQGLMVLLGVRREDSSADSVKLAAKVANLRIFEDEQGKMNRSLLDVGGAALVVSNFTLYGDVRKGNRPSFNNAAGFDEGNLLYQSFCRDLTNCGVQVHQGVYGAMMSVSLVNEGPVTIILETQTL